MEELVPQILYAYEPQTYLAEVENAEYYVAAANEYLKQFTTTSYGFSFLISCFGQTEYQTVNQYLLERIEERVRDHSSEFDEQTNSNLKAILFQYITDQNFDSYFGSNKSQQLKALLGLARAYFTVNNYQQFPEVWETINQFDSNSQLYFYNALFGILSQPKPSMLTNLDQNNMNIIQVIKQTVLNAPQIETINNLLMLNTKSMLGIKTISKFIKFGPVETFYEESILNTILPNLTTPGQLTGASYDFMTSLFIRSARDQLPNIEAYAEHIVGTFANTQSILQSQCNCFNSYVKCFCTVHTIYPDFMQNETFLVYFLEIFISASNESYQNLTKLLNNYILNNRTNDLSFLIQPLFEQVITKIATFYQPTQENVIPHSIQKAEEFNEITLSIIKFFFEQTNYGDYPLQVLETIFLENTDVNNNSNYKTSFIVMVRFLLKENIPINNFLDIWNMVFITIYEEPLSYDYFFMFYYFYDLPYHYYKEIKAESTKNEWQSFSIKNHFTAFFNAATQFPGDYRKKFLMNLSQFLVYFRHCPRTNTQLHLSTDEITEYVNYALTTCPEEQEMYTLAGSLILHYPKEVYTQYLNIFSQKCEGELIPSFFSSHNFVLAYLKGFCSTIKPRTEEDRQIIENIIMLGRQIIPEENSECLGAFLSLIFRQLTNDQNRAFRLLYENLQYVHDRYTLPGFCESENILLPYFNNNFASLVIDKGEDAAKDTLVNAMGFDFNSYMEIIQTLFNVFESETVYPSLQQIPRNTETYITTVEPVISNLFKFFGNCSLVFYYNVEFFQNIVTASTNIMLENYQNVKIISSILEFYEQNSQYPQLAEAMLSLPHFNQALFSFIFNPRFDPCSVLFAEVMKHFLNLQRNLVKSENSFLNGLNQSLAFIGCQDDFSQTIIEYTNIPINPIPTRESTGLEGPALDNAQSEAKYHNLINNREATTQCSSLLYYIMTKRETNQW